MGGRVNDLRGNVVVGARQRLGQLRALPNEVQQLVGEHPIAVEQVLDAHAMQAEGPRDLPALVPCGLVPLRAEERDVLGGARRHLPVECRHGLVDRVLRHDPVGGPLAAGDDDEAGNAVRHDVLAAQLRCLLRLSCEQRAQPGVDALDVLTGQRHGEDLVHVFEDVVDVRRRRRRVRLVEFPVGVRGADQPVPTPRDHEQHALLGAEDDAQLRLEPVARHNEVHALRGADAELAPFADHRLRVIRPHAGGVHDLAGADVEVFAGLQVVGVDTDDPLPDLDKPLHTNPAGHVRAVERGGAGERGNVLGVVDLRVVVGDTAGERVIGNAGNHAKHLPLAEVAVVRHPRRTAAGVAEHVVQQHSGADVAALDEALRQRIEEAHRLHQVRRDALQEKAALDERFPHQTEVELLQVTDAAVHQLRRPARCAARPVPRLNHADAESAGHRVER